MYKAATVPGDRYRLPTSARSAYIVFLLLVTASPAAAQDAGKLFLDRIQPLFKQKCLGCHGDEPKLRGGLDLRSRTAMLKGGDTGPSLIPGNAEKSLLFQAVRHEGDLVMPPKKENKLSTDEVALLKKWIDAGAPWPTQVAKTEWRIDPKDAWAFQPLKKPAVPPKPAGERSEPARSSAIDAFVLAKLEQIGLRPAPPADKLTLLRRVTYDLTGLPPTPAEVDGFLRDGSPDAFDKVIDRLLASPHYGEQWARHWLDVVRYSDTSGYSNDYERPNAWRYRDYVVRSFNQDKPYNRFIVEQIAGDELAASDPENAIAVGFLRMGPWEQTGMSVAAVTRQMFLDDVTNAVGTTFLGLPLNCCRCHDHKFDPLPTRDYYRVQAVFASAQFEERATPFLKSENTAGFEQSARAAAEKVKRTDKRLKEINVEIKASGIPSKGVIEELRRTYRKRLEYYNLEAKRYEPLSFSVNSSKPQDVHVLVGGSLQSPAEKVLPGVLTAVASTAKDIPDAPTGRRLAFAKWVAGEDNPLTARVMVNRIWQHHFGKGLVETSNNFGKMGRRPTHPELLDWLAQYFMENGWSIKSMHRLILHSAAYQQSGQHPDIDKVRKVDSLNQYLSYFPPRRLTAEEVRDSVLAVSGELNPTSGGPPVRPEINWDVAVQPRQIMGALAPIYEPSPTRADRNRRTLYAMQIRGLGNPLLEVFNAADMNLSCERRDQNTVTPQVFALFNSEFSHDMALALAKRLEESFKTSKQQIDGAFRAAFGRLPTDKERVACLSHLERMIDHHRQHPPTKKDLPRRIVRERIAEFTGERVEITEDWDPAGYERNLKPWDVSAETRALAEVCLVILNSNEFMYIY